MSTGNYMLGGTPITGLAGKMGAIGRGAGTKTGLDIIGSREPELTALLIADGLTTADYRGGVGITGTTHASAWANQIGIAGPLLQAAGGWQPTINADGSLTFDGIAQFMQTATFTLNQPITVYGVLARNALGSGNFIWSGFGAANRNDLFQDTNSNTTISLYAGNVAPSVTNYSSTATVIWTAVYNGVASSIQLNSEAAVVADAGAQNASGFTLAALYDGTHFSNVSVSRIIIRSVADNAAKQAQIQSLLRQIYGTP